MNASLPALASGTLFGAGLSIAQMTNPAKVIGFLDVAGAWDASLAFVMGAALCVSALAFQIGRRTGAVAPTPAPGTIDGRLLLGAALFGLGWGIAGFCPGPAVASLVSFRWETLLFVCAMIAGMGAFEWFTRFEAARSAPDSASPHAA
jgi:uncharacterized membrane protein YedE/YeeE